MGWSDDYLEHHGILGQKWGVRRFETASGHLTAAGKKRYNVIGTEVDSRKTRKINRLYDKRDAKRNRISDKINKNTEREIKKRTGLSLEEATKKAVAQNKDLDSGKLKWEDSLWNDINKAEYTKKNLKLEEKSRKIDDKYMKKIDDVRESKGLSDKQKKMIIAGAAIAGTALAAYGGYKIHQANQQNKATKQAIDNATKALNDFKAAQSSMNRPNPIKPTSSSSSQNAAPEIDRATVSHTPIDRIQIDRATVDRIKVDRTPINMDSFNKAAQANDDLVNSLLKKNASSLKGY